MGCQVVPITPVWGLRANIVLSRLLGADDIWLGDHAKSTFPPSAFVTDGAFGSVTGRLSRPHGDGARVVGAFGPRMGTAVTDSIRRSPADLARVWMSLHHLSRGRVVLGIGSGERENTEPF